jgi:hypothetical protein
MGTPSTRWDVIQSRATRGHSQGTESLRPRHTVDIQLLILAMLPELISVSPSHTPLKTRKDDQTLEGAPLTTMCHSLEPRSAMTGLCA